MDIAHVTVSLMIRVTASAASPNKRRLELICQRINELRAHASGRRRGGGSLSWMLRAVADSQCSRRSRRYDVYNYNDNARTYAI